MLMDSSGGGAWVSTAAHELRVVKELLWDVVSSYLKPAERDEVKRAIGWSLTTENDSMFAEAAALADILGEVQLSTGSLLERHKLCSNPQRNLVEAEVKLLMDRLREVASAAPFQGSAVKGRDPDAVIPRASGAEKAVFNYVVGSAGPESRPRTPPTRPASAASPNRPGTASSTGSGGSGNSGCTNPRSVVQSVHSKLNVWDIDAVKTNLQQALQDENAALLDDIQYLQSLLENETDRQAKAGQPTPSIQELKEYGQKLKKALQNEEQRVEHEVRVSRMFSAADEEQSKAARLRGMIQASRAGPAAGPASASTQDSSPRQLPRQRSYHDPRPSATTPESPAAELCVIRTQRSWQKEPPLDRRPYSPGGSLASTSQQSPETSEGGAVRSSSREVLGPRSPLLAAAAAASSGLGPPRLRPLASLADSAGHSLASPSAAASSSSNGVASLPPKPLVSSLRSGPSSEDARRSSSGSTRAGPSVVRPSEGRAGEASGRASGRAAASERQPSILAGSPEVVARSRPGPGAAARTVSSTSAPTPSRVNLVDALDAEVTAMRGGVAAILAKHSYTSRPSSARSDSSLT